MSSHAACQGILSRILPKSWQARKNPPPPLPWTRNISGLCSQWHVCEETAARQQASCMTSSCTTSMVALSACSSSGVDDAAHVYLIHYCLLETCCSLMNQDPSSCNATGTRVAIQSSSFPCSFCVLSEKKVPSLYWSQWRPHAMYWLSELSFLCATGWMPWFAKHNV